MEIILAPFYFQELTTVKKFILSYLTYVCELKILAASNGGQIPVKTT